MNPPGTSKGALRKSELEMSNKPVFKTSVPPRKEAGPGPNKITNVELSKALFGADSRLSASTLNKARKALDNTGMKMIGLCDELLERIDCVFSHFNNEEYERETLAPANENEKLPPLPEPCICGLQHPSPFTWTRQFAPCEEIVQTTLKIAYAVATHEN